MSRIFEADTAQAGLGVLVRLKLTVLRNLLREAVNESPLKLTTSAAFVVLIWFGLFWLFLAIFESIQTTPVEAAVVVPVMFNIFFLALLAFSNAILAYGSLFSGPEPGFLLSAPIAPIHLVLMKYLESLFFASWSLILLGLPLMMAMARSYEESWIFYPLFMAFFLFFVPIPGALGLLLAWLAARISAHGGRRALMAGAVAALLIAAVWTIRTVHDREMLDDQWAAAFFSRMDFIETAVLPSTWVAQGIERALRHQPGEALGYLAVTVSNALFMSLVAVQICARRFVITYDRATSSPPNADRSVKGRMRANQIGTGLCELVFLYLPVRLRLIAGKDLRTFLRDPLQWSQLAILFGLMGLYLLNLPRFYLEIFESTWGAIVPFLNLAAVTLILATFTSRFVFPLVSLEGHQLWLIGLLPVSRGRVLLAKFAYALTVTAGAAIGVTVLAAVSLKMTWCWGSIHVAVTLSVCVGLCGLAVGLGARLPMFGQVNAGRIANGFGGTINLIASVLLVVLALAGMAVVTGRTRQLGAVEGPDGVSWLIIATVMVISIATGLTALHIGARHFKHREV